MGVAPYDIQEYNTNIGPAQAAALSTISPGGFDWNAFMRQFSQWFQQSYGGSSGSGPGSSGWATVEAEKLRAQADKDIEAAREAAAKGLENQKEASSFISEIQKMRGPKDPYGYLFNSRGMATPNGYSSTNILTPFIMQILQQAGIDPAQIAQIQSYLNPSGPSVMQGALGSLPGVFGGTQQPSPPSAPPTTPGTSFMGAPPAPQGYPMAAPPAVPALSPPMTMWANTQTPMAPPPIIGPPSPPGVDQGRPPGMPWQPPGAGLPVQPNPIEPQIPNQNYPTLRGGLGTPTNIPLGAPPMDLNKLAPSTRAAVDQYGRPQILSAYMEKNMAPSEFQGYQDYIGSIAGGNPEDFTSKAAIDRLGPQGAPMAKNYK